MTTSQKLSRSEVVVEPPKPTLIYSVSLTDYQIESLKKDGAVELNLYVTSEFYIRVNIFGDHENEIDKGKISKLNSNFPMRGSWFE